MLIARVHYSGRIYYGLVEDDVVELLAGDIFREFAYTGQKVHMSELKLLAPVEPSTIFGLGRNYLSHNKEMNIEPPELPAFFFKPGRALVASGEPIKIPRWATRVDYEGELGVVIGRKMKNIPEQHVREFLFGYTCFNDVTERDIGSRGLINQDISKCCDTFGPCGPWISTELDPAATEIRTYRNGTIVQKDNTRNMVFSVEQAISYLSRFITLMPGDLIVTGTPGGLGSLLPGDRIEVEIRGIGRLVNQVVAEDDEHSA